jgi:hypothetical protein
MGKKLIYALAAIVLFTGIPGASYAYNFKLADVDWTIGGSVRLDVVYKFSDLGSVPTGQESKVKDWYLENPGNSRLYLKATYNRITAFYEDAVPTNPVGWYTRHLYADYKINDANSLLLGQTTSILAPLDPEQHLRQDKLMTGFGNLYPSRNPQFKYTYKSGGLTAAVALQDTKEAAASTFVTGNHIVEGYIPVVMAAVEYKTDMFMVMPSVYYQTYELKKNEDVATTKSVDVNSWAIALDGTIKTDVVLFAAEVWYGQNLSTWSIDQRSSSMKTTTMGAPIADPDNANDVKNVKSMGGWVQVGIPIKPVTIYAGYGYQQADTDMTPSETYEKTIATQGIYVNAKWEVKKGFYVWPEVAYFDNGKDAKKVLNDSNGNKLGNDLYAGVHFQYDF